MSGQVTTLSGTPLVIAPGKIFLVGEYAVLEEGIAVVAAVSRHAAGHYIPGLEPLSPVVKYAVDHAKQSLGEAALALPEGSVIVNTDAFQEGEEKVGFGSSAATAAVAVGAVFETVGHAIEERKSQIFSVADAAHRAAQGGVGSGADVAAAVFGGVLKIQGLPHSPPHVLPLTPPVGLNMVVFWTGQSASTQTLIEGVKRFAKRDPLAYLHLMDGLRDLSTRFVEEIDAGRATGAVAIAGRYGRQMAALGSAARVAIVTEPFLRADALAKELGGIAKPSGAGGGDIGVAMFATPEAARLFARACQKPLVVLDVDLDTEGLRLRRGDSESREISGMFHA